MDEQQQGLSQVINVSGVPMINSSQNGRSLLLTGLWDEGFSQLGRTLADDTVLFELHFQLVGEPGTSTKVGNDNALQDCPSVQPGCV